MNPRYTALWLTFLMATGPASPAEPPSPSEVAVGHGVEEHVADERTGDPSYEHLTEREGHTGHGHDAGLEVHLTPAQIATLALRTERLQPRALGETLRAPGEVRLNAYATARITPRITAQVTARHARLGDHVEAGQPMVTLSSVELAEIQGHLVVAEREWQRVRELGARVVSEGRYLEAQMGRRQTEARLLAFGMTTGQVDELLRSGAAKANGTFSLLAPQAGTVVADDFVLGELVEPGRTLFEVTDESVRWIEARLSPEDAARVPVGGRAQVGYGGAWLEGRVSQIHHLLDETTRTQSVRLEVPDPGHHLHPGVFVDVVVHAGDGEPVLALPETAVLRGPDGDWQVFVTGDESGAFRPVEVQLVRTVGGLAVIEGLTAGTEVVTHGAFFLASELAKGGFDPHGH